MFSMTKRRAGLLLLLLLGGFLCAGAQRVWVKSNALYWLGTVPNLGVEMRMSPRMTFNVEAGGNYWDISKYSMYSAGIMPEARYWLSGRPQTGHFVGLMGLYGAYKVDFNGDVHNGDAFGFGPTYGYSFVLGSRWGLETTIGLGLLYVRERKYKAVDETPTKVNNTRLLPAPIKAGVTFIYFLK